MTHKYPVGTQLKCLTNSNSGHFQKGKVYTVQQPIERPDDYKFKIPDLEEGWTTWFVEDPDNFIPVEVMNWRKVLENEP